MILGDGSIREGPLQGLVIVSNALVDGELGSASGRGSSLLRSPLDMAFWSSCLDDPLVVRCPVGLVLVKSFVGLGDVLTFGNPGNSHRKLSVTRLMGILVFNRGLVFLGLAKNRRSF